MKKKWRRRRRTKRRRMENTLRLCLSPPQWNSLVNCAEVVVNEDVIKVMHTLCTMITSDTWILALVIGILPESRNVTVYVLTRL